MTEVPVFTTLAPTQPRESGTNRPLIRPPDPLPAWYPREKIRPDGLVAYTRVSTLASYLDDGVGLRAWDVAQTALGVAKHPDLTALVSASSYGDPDLSGYLDAARDRMGATLAANLGTAAHRYCEPGADLTACPEWMRPDVDSYLTALAADGIVQVEAEQFVVCDGIDLDASGTPTPILAAGTFDRIVHVPALERLGQNPRTVLDIKSGTYHYRALSVQLTAYAHGERYEHETGRRRALDVNTRWALAAHVPRGKGRTRLTWIDLRADGYRALDLAGQLRAWRSDPVAPHGQKLTEGPLVENAAAREAVTSGFPDVTAWELEQFFCSAESVEELRAAWTTYQDRMTDRLRAIATARAGVLTGALPN